MQKLKGAYFGKILRVNLSARKVSTEDIPENDFIKLLGGRGIAAKYYFNEIGANTDPAPTSARIAAALSAPT